MANAIALTHRSNRSSMIMFTGCDELIESELILTH